MSDPRDPGTPSLACHGRTSVNASQAHPAKRTTALSHGEFRVACDCRENVSCPRIFHLNGKWKMPTSVTSTKLAEAVQWCLVLLVGTDR